MEIDVSRRFGGRGMDLVPLAGVGYYAWTRHAERREVGSIGEFLRAEGRNALNVLVCLGYHNAIPVAAATIVLGAYEVGKLLV